MNIQEMNDQQYQQLFDVRRSLRYHDRRRAFFERLHQITAVFTVLLAGSVLFEIARPGETAPWMVVMALIAAMLSAWDIVVGYSSKANLHHDLKKRFSALEIAILTSSNTSDAWQSHQVDRVRIEQDEPPIFRALDSLCHNELMIAEGHRRSSDNSHSFATVNLFQRMTRHLFHWGDIAT